MRPTFFAAFAALFAFLSPLTAQQDTFYQEGFEFYNLDSGDVINGRDGKTSITATIRKMNFPVSWDTMYKYWSGGWAMSRKIDGNEGPSSSSKHLYCAKPGWGHEGKGKGKTFIVGQNGSYFTLSPRTGSGDYPLAGFYIANSNYTYNSMKRGDMFAKKFGGSTGKDKDSLLLTIRSYRSGQLRDSVVVFLADYRADDSTRDYLLDSWQFVRFNKGTDADSFTFSMTSSDVGAWGMNTPAFFCMDGMTFLVTLDADPVSAPDVKLYPVPAVSVVNIRAGAEMQAVRLTSITGAVIFDRVVTGNAYSFETAALPAGQYQVRILTRSGLVTRNILVTP